MTEGGLTNSSRWSTLCLPTVRYSQQRQHGSEGDSGRPGLPEVAAAWCRRCEPTGTGSAGCAASNRAGSAEAEFRGRVQPQQDGWVIMEQCWRGRDATRRCDGDSNSDSDCDCEGGWRARMEDLTWWISACGIVFGPAHGEGGEGQGRRRGRAPWKQVAASQRVVQ